MAGVTPQQRGGGSNATTIGMVVSIVVSVVLLAALIFLFTQQEQLRTDAENAQAALRRLGQAESGAVQVMFPEATGPGKSLIGEMKNAIGLMSGRIGGNVNDAPSAAVARLDGALDEIMKAAKVPSPDRVARTNGAAAIVQQLHDWYVAERGAKESALGELAKANDDLEKAVATNKKLEEDFGAKLDELGTKVADMQKAKTEFETVKGDEIKALEEQIAAKADQLAVTRRETVQMRQEFATELSERDRMIEMQMQALGAARGEGAEGTQPLAAARSPVGKVLRALPGDSLVHIDLGRDNNVVLGMTFAVYSSDRRVPSSGRGKANIEVVSIGQRTAECRVTTPPAPDDPILENDLVGNIVLGRNQAKKQRFCIVGEFDLDYDDRPDVRGGAKIAALVAKYGGEIVSRVDATTDYLIVGSEPPVETPVAAAPADADAGDEEPAADEEGGDAGEAVAASSDVDPTRGPLLRRQAGAREAYETAVRRAMFLSVPRIPQDRFLNFVGIESGADLGRQLDRF